MKIYLNTETCLLTLAAGSATPLTKFTAKRGDALDIEVMADLASGATGILAAKSTWSGDPVVLCPSWTAPETSGAGYLFSLSLNTTEINALLTGEVASVTLRAEITWTVGGKTRSTQTFSLIVERDVWRGDEATPTPANTLIPVVQFLDDVPANKTDFFMFDGGVAPTCGLYQAADGHYNYTFKGGWTMWRRAPIASW
ncbi:MAG: hypothetical protein WCS65_09620 [Verrucomicrobiae bacterium]